MPIKSLGKSFSAGVFSRNTFAEGRVSDRHLEKLAILIRAKTPLCIAQFGLSVGSFFLSGGGGGVFGLGFGAGR
jgi:hypothetical protein